MIIVGVMNNVLLVGATSATRGGAWTTTDTGAEVAVAPALSVATAVIW